ncbi:hypothetical protein P4S54_06065 [Shewanella sp. PP-He15 brown]|uniref:hypothetical protein n=1 Tax=Shewanella TaxID=22 RepID=UPI0028920FB7|nr:MULTISPECIES: hypothetical protein [unclassified Shewanella]MDT3294769.1 hypothetical protein [Shewanella sp. SP2S2-6]MDT3307677.1 hypothetical protein [Shewanella sp. SP1S1-4]
MMHRKVVQTTLSLLKAGQITRTFHARGIIATMILRGIFSLAVESIAAETQGMGNSFKAIFVLTKHNKTIGINSLLLNSSVSEKQGRYNSSLNGYTKYSIVAPVTF